MNRSRIFNVILILAALILLWVSREQISWAWSWFSDREAISSFIQRIGIWGPVALFVLFVLQVFLAFIPGQVLMVTSGYLYGFLGGFLVSWISLAAGGEAAFALARMYGRPFAERWVSPDVLTRWDKAAEGQGILFFVVTLVMPLVPNDAMCYVAGLGKISHHRFLVANLLGRGIGCAITSAAGAFGRSLPWQGWAILIGAFFLIGIGWYLYRSRRPDSLTS